MATELDELRLSKGLTPDALVEQVKMTFSMVEEGGGMENLQESIKVVAECGGPEGVRLRCDALDRIADDIAGYLRLRYQLFEDEVFQGQDDVFLRRYREGQITVAHFPDIFEAIIYYGLDYERAALFKEMGFVREKDDLEKEWSERFFGTIKKLKEGLEARDTIIGDLKEYIKDILSD
jgi:hypothetical protein